MSEAPVTDIDVSGERRSADPAHTEAVAQAVALLGAMIRRIEEEHGPIGLDVLLSAYISTAVAQIGIARTIEALGHTSIRLIEIQRANG